jgi:SET domain-containing protein
MLISSSKIYVDTSSISGRGVFTSESILPGEVIEECHFIELTEKDFNKIDDMLKEYVFCFPMGNKNNCVVFGFGSIYNHSLLNNAYWECDEKLKIFRFISNKKIRTGEEVFINYQKWVDF